MKKIALSVSLALASITSMASADVHAREVPTADFFKDPQFTSVLLSPDGKHLAVTVPQNDRTLLAVLETATKKIIGKWDYGKDRHIRGVVWGNDDRLLFSVTKKTGKFDFEVGHGNLYASNIDGSKRIDIPNGGYYRIVDLTPGDRNTVIVSRQIKNAYLSRLNIYTGQLSTIATSPVQNSMSTGGAAFVVDDKGNPLYSFGEMDDGRIVTYERKGENWELVHESQRGGATYTPIAVAADGKRVYFEKGVDGAAESIVLVDPESRKETTVSSNGTVSPGSYLWSTDEKTLLAVRYSDGKNDWDFVAPDHPESKVYSGLVKACPGKTVSFLGDSGDGRWVALRVSSDVDPGEAYLFDKQTGQATFMLANRDWIKSDEMARMEPVEVTTRDGMTIYGYLTTPKGSNGKNLPLIINPHGGPHGPRDSWGFNPEVQFLANRGYAVLQMNYRGSGGYGNAFERAGYRKWGTAMQDDLTDSVRWAITNGIADPNRVCIYGASYGGYAALMSAVREPDLYKCAIGYVGVYDLDVQQGADFAEHKAGRSYLKDVYPETRAERMAQSPAFATDKLKAAVMLVHGEQDVRVPIRNMHLLVSQMEKSGKKPEEVIVEAKEAHGFQDLENQVRLYDRMQKFFDKHIGKK